MSKVYTVIVTVYTDFTVHGPDDIEVHGTVDDTPEEGFVLGVFSSPVSANDAWIAFRNAQVVEETDEQDLTKCPLSSATLYENTLDDVNSPALEGTPLSLTD